MASSWDDIFKQLGVNEPAAAAPAQPTTLYTPNGVPKVPGFDNPYNPHDTGRHGEQNKELNGGQGGKINGWDYDLGRPLAGVQLGSNGLYSLDGGGGGGGGGLGVPGSVDYASILGAPQQLADLSASGISDAAQRGSAIKQALIEFGIVPDFAKAGFGQEALGFLGQDVDENTRQLAQKNTDEGLSIFARLQKANKDNTRLMKNMLAARGMTRSGESAHGLSEEALRYKQARSDATNNLTKYVGGVINNFVTVQRERERQAAYLRALQAAMARASSGGPSRAPAAAAPGFSINPDLLTDPEGVDTDWANRAMSTYGPDYVRTVLQGIAAANSADAPPDSRNFGQVL